jgi:hypothetical protein
VYYCSILHINFIAHADGMHIAANNCLKPDTAVITHDDIAHNRGIFRQITVIAELRTEAAYRFYERHI